MTDVQGHCDERFAGVRDTFAAAFARGEERGASVAVTLDGAPVVDIWAGVADVSSRWHVSHDWAHWRSEVVWMTLYFSVAVWISIGLAHVRLPLRADRPRP